MRNVKVILISVALCATVFANNARIEALGGDAGFWPGDRANAEMFPGALNDGSWFEFGGVDGAYPTMDTVDDVATVNVDESGTASDGSLKGWVNYGDDVKWGFKFDTDASNHDWMNMSWAKDGMGLSVGFISSSMVNTDGTSNDASGFDVAWGSTMSFGEIGVGYKSTDDGVAGVDTGDNVDGASTELWVNWRGDCNLWLFDNAKANFTMMDNGMDLSYDLFTHIKPADGVTGLLSMGFGYTSLDAVGSAAFLGTELVPEVPASCSDATWDGVDEASCLLIADATYDAGSPEEPAQPATEASSDYQAEATHMWLPTATFAVEANMTDWATVRAFVSQDHKMTCDEGGSDCDLMNDTDYGFGVGFGWQATNGGSVNLDMTIGNDLFTDPVHTMTGFGSLNSGNVTLSYLF